MTGKQGARCKVCNSPNKNYYEQIYYQTKGKLSYVRLSEMAQNKGEGISRKSFERHFKNHYTPERIQRLIEEGKIEAKIEQTREETINILDEIKNNLMGLKALIGRTRKTKNLADIVAVYREHRLTLQDIERIRSKLSTRSFMTQAELYKEIFWVCSSLPPECRKDFWVKLDERLKEKGYT